MGSSHILLGDGAQLFIRPINARSGTKGIAPFGVPIPLSSSSAPLSGFERPYNEKNQEFLIEILIQPDKSRIDLMVDAIRVRLLRDDHVLSPIRFWRTTSQSGTDLCDDDFLFRVLESGTSIREMPPNDPAGARVEILEGAPACVVAQFAISPIDPRTEFSIEIGDLRINGKPADVPRLELSSSSERIYGGVPAGP